MAAASAFLIAAVCLIVSLCALTDSQEPVHSFALIYTLYASVLLLLAGASLI